MYTRKKFIKTVAAGSAGIFASSFLMDAIKAKKLDKFGYISGILGSNLGEKNWKSILSQTAEFGYSEIEISNYLGDSAKSFLEFCNTVGLKPVAGGMGMTDDMDELHRSLDRLNALDVDYAVIYWPYFVGAPFSLEDCKRSVDVLNRTGEICKNRGLQLCWHNHADEFVPMEEGLPFDYLMQNTDEGLVKCELDIYWVTKGGANPVEVLKRYSGRYPILHVKDMAAGVEQDFACVGNGIINWRTVFAESGSQGTQHYHVEKDNAKDGLGCLKSAATYLKELRF